MKGRHNIQQKPKGDSENTHQHGAFQRVPFQNEEANKEDSQFQNGACFQIPSSIDKGHVEQYSQKRYGQQKPQPASSFRIPADKSRQRRNSCEAKPDHRIAFWEKAPDIVGIQVVASDHSRKEYKNVDACSQRGAAVNADAQREQCPNRKSPQEISNVQTGEYIGQTIHGCGV